MNKVKTFKTYQCWIEYSDGTKYPKNITATSASKARYQFYMELDNGYSYSESFKWIKTKSLGVMKPSHLYSDLDNFNRMKERRILPFIEQGMIVDVSGQKGFIVGSNSSSNLDVIFEGQSYKSNCHPTWDITYYDKEMNIIKDFKGIK